MLVPNIECGCWLIEKNYRTSLRKCPSNCYPLAFATGQRRGHAFEQMADAQQLQRLIQRHLALRGGDALLAVLQIPAHAQVREQVGVLEHVADGASVRRQEMAAGAVLPQLAGYLQIALLRAIQAGDAESGVTVMQMEAGLDTGPMLLKVSTPISAEDTGGSLHDRLAELGPPAVLQAIDGLAGGSLRGEVQDDSLATYAHKLNKDEALLDWSHPAVELERLIRAFNPWPICHSSLNGAPLKVLAAQLVSEPDTSRGAAGEILAASKDGLTVACADGALRLTRLQLPGGKALNFADLFNSRREQFAVGSLLGASA